MNAHRTVYSSGSPYEATVGYSRAVRAGNLVCVSGTTAPGADAGEQATVALERIVAALENAGARAADVVRTRVYLTDMGAFDAVAKAHSAVFAEIRPATTFVEISALADPALLVEIEADAVIPPSN
jgi:enamine deaminase RidA (YjgF/YER057c/UK114 family)